MPQVYPTLFKRDSKGQIRIWWMEQDGDKYRTVSGLKDGQLVETEWTVAEPKNVGRKNETTGEQQAQSEVESTYTKKLDVDYHKREEDVDTPKIFQPMLAQEWGKRKAKVKYDTPVWFQPKLDGIRCIATRHGLFSRKGKPIIAVPHILAALQPAFEENPDAVFDGELYNHDFHDDFNEISSIVRKAKPKPEDIQKAAHLMEYHVYDYPALMHEPFSTRIDAMVNLLMSTGVAKAGTSGAIQIVPSYICRSEADVDVQYEVAVEQNYEGGIIRIDEVYQQKRSANLLKRKDFDDEEFEIVEIQEGQGQWSGAAKHLRFRNNQGECGIEGSGIAGTYDFLKQVLAEKDQYVGGTATIRFFRRTPDRLVPRFPVAKDLHKGARVD